MKKTLIAALALVAMVGCSKENTETTIIDPTAPVAASFTSASITRVADNAWVENDKIGITMVVTADTALADGDYENVPYTVKAAGASGTFSADDEVIYFPVDDSTPVDFIAYYPYTEDVDTYKYIAISVADQSYEHIDLVAAKAENKTKSSPTVTFTDNSTSGGENEAFSHQLSKLTMNIVAGDGITALTGVEATIKGQYTTAKFNIYSFEVIADAKNNITALTTNITAAEDITPATAIIEAILIPTTAIADSTIEFALDGNTYYLDTKDFVFTKGCEHTYTITLTRTEPIISGATISNWGSGAVVSNGELDASDLK